MLKRAAPNGATRDSIFCPACELCICAVGAAHCAATRNGTNGTFRSIQDFAGRNRTGGQAIVAPRIAGGKQHCCQSTAAFRRESIGRLKAADKTASCRNERSLW